MKLSLVVSLVTLMLSVSAFAQSFSGNATAITMSPFATATRVIESGIATITAGVQTAMAPFATTLVSIEARGVAGKEQLRDEMVGLDRDMQAGLVRDLNDIRQPSIKELFSEILADEEEMEKIHSFVQDGTEMHKIATVVTLKLFH